MMMEEMKKRRRERIRDMNFVQRFTRKKTKNQMLFTKRKRRKSINMNQEKPTMMSKLTQDWEVIQAVKEKQVLYHLRPLILLQT